MLWNFTQGDLFRLNGLEQTTTTRTQTSKLSNAKDKRTATVLSQSNYSNCIEMVSSQYKHAERRYAHVVFIPKQIP